MRFSETLRFNANPDWWIYYIPYDDLKLHVEELHSLSNSIFFSRNVSPPAPPSPATVTTDDSTDDEGDIEARLSMRRPVTTLKRPASQKVLADLQIQTSAGYSAALAGLPIAPLSPEPVTQTEPGAHFDPVTRFNEREAVFFAKLNKHARVVEELFKRLSNELKDITASIQQDASTLLDSVTHSSEPTRSGQVEDMPLLPSGSGGSPDYGQRRQAIDHELKALKSRLVEHYKELGETMNFSTLNKTGFDKILKKHDKYTGRYTRPSFMSKLHHDMSFTDPTELQMMQMQTERIYAMAFRKGDLRAAKEELKAQLRDLIVWDRNTIWRDVLRTERKVSAFHSVKGGYSAAIDGIGKIKLQIRPVPFAAALLAFVFILCFPQLVRRLPIEGGAEYSEETLNAAHRCLALVACVVTLWAFEGVPLYVASLLVFPGVVLLAVFLDDKGAPLSSLKASSMVFEKMSSPTLMLIICVYTLGAALSKFEVDKLAANIILSKIHRPGLMLIMVMFLSVIVSMFVSNVAAPVLLNSVMMPTIDAMRNAESNRTFVRCLLLGIMIASNIGGFASPISSPQSAVALGLLAGEHKISFAKWLVVALPQCIAMVLTCFVALYIWYRPNKFTLPPLPRVSERFRWPHWVIVMSIFLTILIWSDHALQDVFGSAGIVAVLPVLVFFGSGILTKEDFNNLPWDVVYLVAGGIVLGAAVESCKLLDLVAERLTHEIGESNLYGTYLVFCVFLAVVANAVSHTVSSIIVLPLVYKIGTTGVGHPQLLVLGGTFAASSAMALPISSFPNISATRVEDETGDPYLSPAEVLRVGSVMTVLVTIVLLTFGFAFMSKLLD